MPTTNLSPQLDTDALLVLGGVIIAVMIINMVPFIADYFDHLYTALHELGYVTATMLTGGEVKGFKVFRRSTGGAKGMATRKGGDAFLVNPAGYMGVTFFSAGLMH